MDDVYDIMQDYCERTDGSHIIVKEACIKWDFKDADLEMGRGLALKMQEQLRKLLQKEPV